MSPHACAIKIAMMQQSERIPIKVLRRRGSEVRTTHSAPHRKRMYKVSETFVPFLSTFFSFNCLFHHLTSLDHKNC